VLRHVARQLRDLDVLLQIALERAEDDLALPRLEAVDEAGDGALEVGTGEEDELLGVGGGVGVGVGVGVKGWG